MKKKNQHQKSKEQKSGYIDDFKLREKKIIKLTYILRDLLGVNFI